MSKKKLRKTHHRRSHQRVRKTKDVHHLCFTRSSWSSKWANSVRKFHYCTIEIPRDTLHKFIHANVDYIPVPSETAARDAYVQLLRLEKEGMLCNKDTIEKRLTLLIAIFSDMAKPTADGFKKQLTIVQRFYEKPL